MEAGSLCHVGAIAPEREGLLQLAAVEKCNTILQLSTCPRAHAPTRAWALQAFTPSCSCLCHMHAGLWLTHEHVPPRQERLGPRRLSHPVLYSCHNFPSAVSVRSLAPDSLLPEHLETMIPFSNPAFWI